MKKLVYRTAFTLAVFTFTLVLLRGGRLYVAGFRALVVLLGVLIVFMIGGILLRLGLILMTPKEQPEQTTQGPET